VFNPAINAAGDVLVRNRTIRVARGATRDGTSGPRPPFRFAHPVKESGSAGSLQFEVLGLVRVVPAFGPYWFNGYDVDEERERGVLFAAWEDDAEVRLATLQIADITADPDRTSITTNIGTSLRTILLMPAQKRAAASKPSTQKKSTLQNGSSTSTSTSAHPRRAWTLPPDGSRERRCSRQTPPGC
jgi:hypothetical protein